MKFRWSKHASQSMADREIPRAAVEGALGEPELLIRVSPSRQFFMRRYFDDRLQQPMLVRALVEEAPDGWTVVTVYITSKIGKYMSEASHESDL